MRALFGKKSTFSQPLAHMLGIATPQEAYSLTRMSPQAQQRTTFDALRAVVLRLVARGPTVLALEDLHWADPTSLHVSAELATITPRQPIASFCDTAPGP